MFHLPPELISLRTLIDGFIAFLVLGLTEAVIKPLAKAAIDRPLRRTLPYVYERLDNEMPTLLRKADPRSDDRRDRRFDCTRHRQPGHRTSDRAGCRALFADQSRPAEREVKEQR